MQNSKLLASLLMSLCLLSTTPLTTSQFEKEKKLLQQRIQYIQQTLLQNEKQKKASVGQLTAMQAQITSNEALIRSVNQALQTIDQALVQQQAEVTLLTQDLVQLQKEYTILLYEGAKATQAINTLVFIFSATSFQKLVHRLQYIKQYITLRKKHFQDITTVLASLQHKKKALLEQKKQKKDLLTIQKEEKVKLLQIEKQKKNIIRQLEQHTTQLYQELNERNAAIKQVNKLIHDVLQQEQIAAKAQLRHVPSTTPQAPQPATTNFAKQHSKLPWPVKKGFISSPFGTHPHPVLPNILVDNLGIDIQTQAGATAYTVFEGVVKTVALVPGMQRVVILQHGDYHTVYAKLKTTCVKVGQHIKAQQALGVVYTDAQGTTVLQLQLWKGIQKLNPAGWLRTQ